MKKSLIFAFTLLVVGFVYAQDTLQTLTVDSTAVHSSMSMPDREGSMLQKADADSAYMREDYTSAIDIYETILQQGEAAELYYNLGNSYYKAGEIAKAILNYERALLLQPGNSDIQTNLSIARSKTIDKVEPAPEIFLVSWSKSLVNCMSVDAWANWGIVFFILFLVSLYFFIFSKQSVFKKIGFIGGILFLLFTVLSNVFASQQKDGLLNRDNAIIISPSVTIRSTPNDSGTTLFILHEGTKVTLKDDSMREWKEIRLEDGKVGWLPVSSIEII